MEFGSYASNEIYKESKKYGIKATAISYRDNFILLEYKWKKELIKQTATRFTNLIQGRICDNKFLAIQYLRDHWIHNIPQNIVIESLEEVDWENIKYPIVIKPQKWHGGKWVSVGIKNKKEFQNAFQIAKKEYFRVLIEEQVEWDDYRFLVIGKKIFVTKRLPANITWNWTSTILELIDKENTKRESAKDKLLVPIKIDQEVERMLKNQTITLQTIPKKWETIFLRKNANLSTWGNAIEYTDKTHEENKKLAFQIAKIMDMKIIAIDFLFKDIHQKYSKDNGIVIEINDTPWIRLHHPREKEVVKEILELLFPNSTTWKY